MWKPSLGILLHILGSATAIGLNVSPLYHTDSCDESGRKAVTCEEGYVIKVVDVRCMPANYTCIEFDVISRLCNGITSCAQVDVRRHLFSYCQNYPKQRVYTSFKCVPSTFMPSCRTNLCGDDSPNLRCRRGSVFHLVNISCYNGTQQCPSNVYDRVYRLCQSQRDCNLNELQANLPQFTCKMYINVYMDHICIEDTVVSSKCTGSFIDQVPRFGVLTNPGFPGNHDGLPSTCYWAIYPDTDRGEEVEITIHQAHSVEGTHVCDTQYLQIQYSLCNSNSLTIHRFCEEKVSNIKIHSCGTVFVTHYPFPAGNDRGNRFLISYQVLLQKIIQPPRTGLDLDQRQ